MSDKVLLDKIGKIIVANNKALLKAVDTKFVANNKVLLEAVDQKFLTNNKILLEAVDEKFVTNNDVLLEAVDQKITASEKRTKAELTAKIDESREDIIEVFMDVVNTGYKMTDKRLKKVEEKLGISSPKPQ